MIPIYITAVALVLIRSSSTDAFQPPLPPYMHNNNNNNNNNNIKRFVDPSVAHRRQTTSIIRNLADPSPYDDDGYYDNVELSEDDMQIGNMQDMLTSLINTSSTPKIARDGDSAPVLMKEPSTDQLQQLVSQLEAVIVDNEGPQALNSDDDDENDAPYLDESAYTNYRNSVNQDGSLTPPGGVPMDYPSASSNNMKSAGSSSSNNKFDQTTRTNLKALVNPKPEIPDSYYTAAANQNAAPTLEDLFSVQQPQADAVDEDLHKQIMAQEEGFQKQSKLFQGYLQNGDEASGEEAAYMLREQRRRKEQEEMLLQLEREMAELDNTLNNRNSPSNKEINVILCTKCKCPLRQVEIESGQGDGMCQVCYGDMIAQTSDMRFLDAPPVEYTKSSYRQQQPSSKYRQQQPSSKYRQQPSSSPSRPSRRIETPAPSRPPAPSSSTSRSTQPLQEKYPSRPITKRMDDGEVAKFKRQIVALQQQVQKYRQKAETAEQLIQEAKEENGRLRQMVVELEDKLNATVAPKESEMTDDQAVGVKAPWMEVIDPDSGEVFYWNEDTEEMRWEME